MYSKILLLDLFVWYGITITIYNFDSLYNIDNRKTNVSTKVWEKIWIREPTIFFLCIFFTV